MTNYFEVDKAITCSGTAPIASTAVDIYAIKEGKDPLLMKRLLAVTAGAWTTTMTVPKTYVAPFGEVYLKVVDSYNPTIAGTKFYTVDPTLTMDTPTLTGGASGTVSGTSNHVGQKIEVELRLADQDPEDSWTPFGQATVDGSGDWSVTSTAPAAGTYDFRVIDENIDPDVCNAQVDDVVVASGAVMIDDFESYADGQSLISYGGWTSASGATVSTTYAHSGTKSMKLPVDGDYYAQRKTLPSAMDLTGKKISFRIRRSGIIYKIRVRVYISGSANSWLEITNPVVSNTSFTELVMEGVLSDYKNVGVIEIAVRSGSGFDYVYIDDLKIV